MVDFPINSIPCFNNVPSCSGVISYTDTAYAGYPFCFDIYSYDPDPLDTVFMFWDVGIPGASMNITPGPLPVGHFCWTPTTSDIRPQPYSILITLRDNGCPIVGISHCTFQIFVVNPTGIPENIYNNFTEVFPNPSKGKFTVSLKGNNPNILCMQVINYLGQTTYENLFSSELLDFNLTSKGIYYLLLMDAKGNIIYRKKTHCRINHIFC